MSANIHCCKNCVEPQRHVGCHVDCELYIKELADYRAIHIKEIREKQALSDYIAVKRNGINAVKKKSSTVF
jgi:hypothetical protein